MAALTEPVRVSDLILWEADPRYTRGSVTFRNATGAAATFPVGQSLKLNLGKYEPDNGDVLAAVLLKELKDVPNASDVLIVPVLFRGPAILNRDRLAVLAGSTVAGAVADLAALSPPVLVVDEPDNVTEG